MPSSGKLFLVPSGYPLEEFERKLKGYRVVEKFEDLDLIKDITKLSRSEDQLSGLYSYDYVVQLTHRGKVLMVPVTQDALFVFGDKDWLLVLAPKVIANNVANKLSEIIFGEMGEIREAPIQGREFDHYIKLNDGIKVAFFEDLDIPNINKSTLYGEELLQTDLFGKFRTSGRPRWIITKSKQKGLTVGIANDGAATVFNNIDSLKFIDFVEDEMLPLVLRTVTELPTTQTTLIHPDKKK